MDGQAAARRGVPKEVGRKIVEVAEATLAEALGRSPEPADVAEMAECVVSELLSGAYLYVREGGPGPKEAESWLRRTLGLAAAAVRMRGSDALIKVEITVQDLPNRIARPPSERPAPERPTAPPTAQCACAKTPEGACLKCSEVITAVFAKTFGFFREMANFKGSLREICAACQVEQLDRAVSTLVESLFETSDDLDPDAKGSVAQEVLAMLLQLGTAQGAGEMPLTIAAWKAAAARRGIPSEFPA